MVQILEGNNILNVQMVRIVGNLSGVVGDAATLLPLQGVSVTIDGLTVITDAIGEYGFSGLIPGVYQMIFSKVGYETQVR